MLCVQCEKWGQSLSDLRAQAIDGPNKRTRERFMALYEIASETTNATVWAADNGRHYQSVQSWIHAYNVGGPEAVTYRHTGGWAPLFARKSAR
jgi:hypothetical protein